MDTSGLPLAKGTTRKQVKARRQRQARKIVKSVRAQVVKRAGEWCERCGMYAGNYGHAHHRIPRSRGGKWTVENIEYLCWRCHVMAHALNDL